eukprot:gnl/Chilomastix_cuspidata/2736.p1 GENE.gnl/Chilomastix_cuspidata/2736~~gnl/Chilomastix_cuspidata/2736.p1  ORF type:complete len:388 (+),score=103.58 gnl/Chilomastix_cuspidata/2736:898-2061(+)
MKTVLDYAFAVAMLVFGTVNTVSVKLQDEQSAPTESDGESVYWEHPVFQTTCMFLGEALCFLADLCARLARKRRRTAGQRGTAYGGLEPAGERSSSAALETDELDAAVAGPSGQAPFPWRRCHLFLLSSICDLCATTLMNAGLVLIYASLYQMLRAVLIVFIAVLSVTVLHRRLLWFHWLGVGLIAAGALTVVFATVYMATARADATADPLRGMLLVVVAQVVVAFQYALQERFLARYGVSALTVVGVEGLFGLVVSLAVATPIAQAAGFDNFVGAFHQMKANSTIILWVVVSVLSIACFNFVGVGITQRIGAGARATVDAIRTFSVWAVCLISGMEEYSTPVLLCYLVMTVGSLFFNEVFVRPKPKQLTGADGEAIQPVCTAPTRV